MLGQGLVAVTLGAALIRRKQAGDQGRDDDGCEDEAAGRRRLDGDARPHDLLGHGGRAEGAEDAQDDRDLAPAEQLGQGPGLGGDGGGPGLMGDQGGRIGRRGQHGGEEQIGRADQGFDREEQQGDGRQEDRQGDPDPGLVLLLEMAAVDGQTDQRVHDDVDQADRQQDGAHGRQRQPQALRIERRHETERRHGHRRQRHRIGAIGRHGHAADLAFGFQSPAPVPIDVRPNSAWIHAVRPLLYCVRPRRVAAASRPIWRQGARAFK
ncbi:hypothetical protein D3C80_700930 [compost metagenome]